MAAIGKRPREEGEVEEGEVADLGAEVVEDTSTPAPPAEPAPPPAPTSCTHTVAMPPGGDVDPAMVADPPETFGGMDFPFALDPFQRAALAVIDRSESVLVAAHTSAGKTVVAQVSTGPPSVATPARARRACRCA